MLAGLMSSSVKSGSKTDTGLGRSDTSTAASRSSSFLVIEDEDGDVDREDRGCISLCES